jgi:hypothetical protein
MVHDSERMHIPGKSLLNKPMRRGMVCVDGAGPTFTKLLGAAALCSWSTKLECAGDAVANENSEMKKRPATILARFRMINAEFSYSLYTPL